MTIRSPIITLLSFTLSTMICNAAFADDLEIYLGTGTDQTTYAPNVLFIMDTSGSMTDKDGGTESRMLRVQNALKETLSTVTNVNAGLMRFSDYGGPILFPTRPIDDPVAPELISSIAQSSDDAYEISSAVSLTGNYVKLSDSTNTVYTGLRYQDLNIPQGATITSAYMRFASNQINTAATSLNLKAELVGNATTFVSTNQNISGRTTTAAEVDWSADNNFPVTSEFINSPDLSAVIQEVVDQATWCGGNSLNIIIQGNSASNASARQAKSFEEGTGLSPQLVVVYDDTTATGCVQGKLSYQVSAQKDNAEEKTNGYESTGSELTFDGSTNAYIGMRFRNIGVPNGANITNAYLLFTAYQNSSSAAASFNIRAANVDDSDDFNPYSRYMLRDIAKTAAVSWTAIPEWDKNNSYASPAITSVVKSIVDRAGWQLGNDMTLIISNISGVRGAYSYQGKPSGAVQLIIEYQGAATPGSTSTVREHLINKVEELSASGVTPIVDTLLEAANYFGGLPVDYGLERGTSRAGSTVRKNTRVSHRSSYLGADSILPFGCSEDDLSNSNCVNEKIPAPATYISPITDAQCQTNNHIVLLSDGEANNNHSASKIQTLLDTTCSGSAGELCGLELVKNIGDTEDSVIGARVVTHTIGFAANATASNFLNQIALQSGGGFYQASNSADLVTAFQSILKTVKDVNTTFVSPGVAVNQLNRLTHKDELYFALFKPAEGTIWPGNLKKYKIDGDVIKDKNGQNAVDDGTGFFSENSQSYWSTLVDGNDVREGGAASQVDLLRNIYTFSGTGPIVLNSNEFHENNANITTTDLALDALPSPTLVRDTVMKWARGVDVKDDDNDGLTDDVRLQMGDPIHSQPVIVNYSATDSAILVATNHGFLHSIDPTTGDENFAVIPKELLGNLYDFYKDGSSFNHLYGLDGDMVLRSDDYRLYVGMRRGGNNYYSFDISNKTAPSLVFKIEGGSAGFEKLGQTWSRPTLTKIKVGATTKNVMIFGGGYDDDQDNKTLRGADAVGNAVYIVDADDGSLIWTASNSAANLVLSDMQYSIPARISVIDRENDGYADHMYVADTGGQLFRLDIHNGESGNDLVTGGLFASLGGDTEEDNRRFYYGPDVSEISLGDDHYYAVALGSGYRAHPLNSVINDNFYMLKDYGVFAIDVDGNHTLPSPAIVESDIYDATDHLLTSSDVAQQQLEATAFAQKDGWLIHLGSGGEKALASPLILDYKILFTTYVPATASTSTCAPPTGNSRAYLVELINGNAVADLDNDGIDEPEDRYAQLKQTGIAPETKVLIEDIIKPVVCLGTECTSAVKSAVNCNSDFSCLVENLYGNFERVQESSWKTETERQ
jgi:type IV pilus assembly protein PilY1